MHAWALAHKLCKTNQLCEFMQVSDSYSRSCVHDCMHMYGAIKSWGVESRNEAIDMDELDSCMYMGQDLKML